MFLCSYKSNFTTFFYACQGLALVISAEKRLRMLVNISKRGNIPVSDDTGMFSIFNSNEDAALFGFKGQLVAEIGVSDSYKLLCSLAGL